MSQGFNFWKDCWIYTKKKERDNMRAVIAHLRKNKSTCISKIRREYPHIATAAIRNAILYLLAARVIYIQQHHDVRVINLNKGWLSKLTKATTPHPKMLFKKSQSKSYSSDNIVSVQKEVEVNGIQTT